MTSKLEVYNFALGHLGERKVASLSENVEARRVLDDYYSQTVTACLENGMWNFAQRSVSLTASTEVTPSFGYSNAFEKPSDWVNTITISEDPYFGTPLMRISEEAGLWYTDAATLYVQYVSSDTSFGLDLSLWPSGFVDYVSASLARRACKRLTSSDSLLDIMDKLETRALRRSKARDAVNQPPAFPPTGTWVNSRGSGAGRRSRWDGTTV